MRGTRANRAMIFLQMGGGFEIMTNGHESEECKRGVLGRFLLDLTS